MTTLTDEALDAVARVVVARLNLRLESLPFLDPCHVSLKDNGGRAAVEAELAEAMAEYDRMVGRG